MDSSTAIPYRPLGIIKNITDSLGHEITHCYEDLIFMAHNAFLLRMEETPEDVSLFFNVDCEQDKREQLTQSFSETGKNFGLKIIPAGTYSLKPNEENNTIDIEFHS